MIQHARPWACAVVLAAAGCMLVAPVEDLPSESRGGSSGTGGTAAGALGAGTTALGGEGGDGAPGGEGGVPSPGRCSTNLECSVANHDEPYRCVRGSCQRLTSPECPRVFGAAHANDENAVFFGAYAELGKPNIEVSTAMSLYRMARDEFDSEAVPGLPGGSQSEWRPLVMIACDNRSEAVDAAMQHLAEKVEVPAVLATLEVGDLLRLYRRYNDPTGENREIFFLSPYGGSRQLLEIRSQGLLWTMLGSPSDFAPIYRAVLSRVERELPAELQGQIKVATVSSSDLFSQELTAAVEEVLEFNGAGVAANSRNGRYLPLAIDETDAFGSFDTIVGAISELRPQVVLSFAGPSFVAATQGDRTRILLEELEAPTPPGERPYYVFSPLNISQIESVIAREIGSSSRTEPAAYRRFLAVGAKPGDREDVLRKFQLRVARAFPRMDPMNPIPNPNANNLYDAFYFLAHAMGAVTSTSQLTGREIAASITRLTARGAPEYTVGPEDSLRIFERLSTPFVPIQLIGTLGQPDFDATQGTRIENGSLTCFAPSPGDAFTIEPLFDAVTYEPSSEQLVGDLPSCFRQP